MSVEGTTLTVCAEMEDGWVLATTHLFVGDIEDAPQTKKGNPKVGRFPYKAFPMGADSYCYEIDITEYVNNGNGSGCVDVAFHASVALLDGGSVIQTETAWGAGSGFPGASWATYTEFCFADCDNNGGGGGGVGA